MPVTNPTTTSSAARHNAVSGVFRRPRKSRHNLSRSERAKVRILHEWDLNYVDIAVEVDCTPQTVGSILHNCTIAAAGDDPERDYDHVDEAFKKKYPPQPPTRSPSVEFVEVEKDGVQGETARVQQNAGVQDIAPRQRIDIVDEAFKKYPPFRQARSPSVEIVEDAKDGVKEEENKPVRVQQDARAPTITPRQKIVRREALGPASVNIPAHGGSSSPASVAQKAKSPLGTYLVPAHNDMQDIVEDLETPVKRFLASLDHDLTFTHDALKKQRLGTANKLFSLGNFTDSELHELFREALPDITVAERYILIKGLKKRMQN